MKYHELKNMPEKELQELLSEKRGEFRARRFQAHERQLKQVHQLGQLRKTIAKILTALKEKSV